MKNYLDLDRKKSLDRLIPDLFDHKSVLYIGARSTRFDFGKDFIDNGYDITIVEAYRPNVKYLESIPFVNKVIHADIRKLNFKKKYDIVFWWHGPEHILIKQLKPTLDKLESIAKHAVVLGCPWGKYIQGVSYGNEFEKHQSHYDYKVFESLGYNVECLGNKDSKGSNITNVKFIK